MFKLYKRIVNKKDVLVIKFNPCDFMRPINYLDMI
jgi:hypothetical protein